MKQKLSRREFVHLSAVAGLTASCSSPSSEVEFVETVADPLGRSYGVQTYTVRSILPQDPDGVLKAISEIGYKEIEISGTELDELSELARKHSLSIPCAHFEVPLVTGNWEPWGIAPDAVDPANNWENAVERAKNAGMSFMALPYLMPSERGGLDFYRKFADQINAAGEVCSRGGLKLCYHHHAFEFEPIESTSPFEVMIERLDPDLAGIELDIFWCSVAGIDPVMMLDSYAGRIPLVHLKDKAENTPVLYSEQDVSPEAFKEVGNGVLDFGAILDACERAGVKHFFVEQDQCPGDPLDSLRQSYSYLASLG